jgi:DNA repair photolyase
MIVKGKSMRNYTYPLQTGIRRSPEFAKKQLAAFAVNVGVRCGHDCTYCSSRATLRCHRAFKAVGESPFGSGYSIVDPDMAEKVTRDAKSIQNRGLVQLCTTVDAWAPEAQKYDLGRRCLEALLAEPAWTVRILTKNAAVVRDFDLITKHRDRVLVGLSLTGTPDKDKVLAVIEPHASPISERLMALEMAHKMGLRTYGMLCPLLPGIANDPKQIDWLVGFLAECGVEEVFSEAANPRGNGLRVTEDTLRTHGFEGEAATVSLIRGHRQWSPYVAGLVSDMQRAMRKHMTTTKLRFLLYPTGLTPEDEASIREADAGVVWL